MATQEQKDAVRKVALAVKILNTALDAASDHRVFIELHTATRIGARNQAFFIATSETRETIFPSRKSTEAA